MNQIIKMPTVEKNKHEHNLIYMDSENVDMGVRVCLTCGVWDDSEFYSGDASDD